MSEIGAGGLEGSSVAIDADSKSGVRIVEIFMKGCDGRMAPMLPVCSGTTHIVSLRSLLDCAQARAALTQHLNLGVKTPPMLQSHVSAALCIPGIHRHTQTLTVNLPM